MGYLARIANWVRITQEATVDVSPSRDVARDMLVYTVAEGVETAEEADVCMHIGFTHAQGFFFGRPRPIEEI